jgi:hypothetical protein
MGEEAAVMLFAAGSERQVTERRQSAQDAATDMESSWSLNSFFMVRC